MVGRNKKEHDERLKAVLQRLKQNGVTLNRLKSKFGTSSVRFLVHFIKEGRIYPDKGKVEAVLRHPAPENVLQVRQILGMNKLNDIHSTPG